MPTYTFKNKKTGEEFIRIMTISEMEEFIKEENIEMIFTPFSISYNDMKKPHGDFRDRLKEIKKSHLHSTINTY